MYGRAGQGRAGQGRAGQGRAGKSHATVQYNSNNAVVCGTERVPVCRVVWCGVVWCRGGQRRTQRSTRQTGRDAIQDEAAGAEAMVGGKDEMRWVEGGMGETGGGILGWLD
jgi:hypothetical protein